MSVDKLEIKTDVSVLKVDQLWSPNITITITNLNGVLLGIAALNRGQVHLLMLYLQEHLK